MKRYLLLLLAACPWLVPGLVSAPALAQTHAQNLSTLGIPMPAHSVFCNGNNSISPAGTCIAGANVTIAGGVISATGGTGSPGGSTGQIQFNNAGAFGGISTIGSGNVVLATSPTLVTPTLGVALATSINSSIIPTLGGTLPGSTGSFVLGDCLKVGSTSPLEIADNGAGCGSGGGGGSGFNAITSGSNTTATMTVGTGASLSSSGGGVLSANEINALAVPASAALLATNSSSQPTAVTLSGCLSISGGVLSVPQQINAQTGATYTIVAGDACKLVTMSNASPVAVTLPQATGSFTTGFSFDIENKGAGLVTITPTTSLINGAATLTVAKNTGCSVTSDGTNYQVSACSAIGQVTSVGLSTNAAFFTVGSSPITSSGTITLNATTGESANEVVATPNGSTGVVSLRALVYADLPTIANNTVLGNTSGSTAVPAAVSTVTYLLDEGATFSVSSGTGACATSSTLVGGTAVGSVKCTDTTGASTLIISLPTATNSIWVCSSFDTTTTADTMKQTAYTASTATFSGTIAANDVIAFGCVGS